MVQLPLLPVWLSLILTSQPSCHAGIPSWPAHPSTLVLFSSMTRQIIHPAADNTIQRHPAPHSCGYGKQQAPPQVNMPSCIPWSFPSNPHSLRGIDATDDGG
uniref:Secreted protein n=1 Tax=Eutreptiella gymnastica TaxID=73025 RepID=A0A7S4GB99_9EUGL